METLPNEILDRIIGYLDKEALLSVRLVSKPWQTYAEGYLRKAVHFSLESDKDVSDLIRITSWRNENTIPIQPFVRFSICGVLSKGISEDLSSKYGNAIQSLRFEVKKARGYPTINHSIIFELLMKTPNIQELYLMNDWNTVDMKLKYELYLSKLRILELERMDTDFVILILNFSPNIQQIKFGHHPITEDNWRDYITIFQSIATRGIQLKLGINICSSDNAINLQRLKEIVKIPFKVTELMLTVESASFVTTEWALVRDSIEEFIHKHSTTFKLLHVQCNEPFKEALWKLDLNKVDNLEQLKLHCSSGRNGIRFQVNIGQAPILKEVEITCDAELNVESSPLLKHLRIETINASEYFKRPLLLDARVRLEKLCLNFKEEGLTTTEADVRVQLFNNYLLSQSNNIKELEIGASNSSGMDKLQLPVMKNLKRLLCHLTLWKMTEENIKQSSFPHLELLRLGIGRLPSKFSLNESMRSVRTLILGSSSLFPFRNTIQRFPMLKKLHIIGKNVPGILTLVFKNMRHLEELRIDSVGTSLTSDFVGEPSTTSVPTLGDLINLKRLIIGRGRMDELKAISYLISCGELTNLRYFETELNRSPNFEEQRLISSFIKIIESNNTRTKIIPYG